MQTFDTPTAISVALGIPAGRIQLIAADRADTTVEVRPTDATRTRDVAAAERIQVGYDDGVLRVQAAEPEGRLLGSSGSVDVTIQLPAGSQVEAEAASAELRAVGRLGDVTFEVAAGTVKLDETAQASLTLQSGDITVGRLGGPGHLSTQQGDLTVTEAVDGDITLRTQHGDITIGAARGASATLDAGTTYGRVRNELTSAAGAAAGLAIHATTADGDIVARSL